jgi:hypothetical protein
MKLILKFKFFKKAFIFILLLPFLISEFAGAQEPFSNEESIVQNQAPTFIGAGQLPETEIPMPDKHKQPKEAPQTQEGTLLLSATIYNAWWSNRVDNDGDGYARSARLNWDPDVAGGSGSLTVYEKIYWKYSSSSTWTYFYTTGNHTITGTSTSDAQYIDINSGSHNLYDWRIDIYQSGLSSPDYTRDPSNDSDLNDVKMETASEDAASYITVITPNGGEVIDERSTYEITWTSQGIGSTVNIWITADGGKIWTPISQGTNNDGSFWWTVGYLDSNETDCRVKIEDANNPGVWDWSDRYFMIRNTETVQFTVDQPNGGEIWNENTTYDIKWRSQNTSGNVSIFYSFDEGTNWTVIYSSTPDDGIAPWTTPSVNTDQTRCRVKVQDKDNASYWDMSNYNFTIKNKDLPPAKQYFTYKIPGGFSPPTLDGVINEPIWSYVKAETLKFGGVPESWDVSWTNWSDNLVTWKAVWSNATNKIYVAITVKDDIRGIFDHSTPGVVFEPWKDECLEFFTDGDNSGGYYEDSYDKAQQWLLTGENKKVLDDYPSPGQFQIYPGDELLSAVSWGADGNWTCEAEFKIYNSFPSLRRTLVVGDIIGWNIWYDDSDNQSIENGRYTRDHQVGWVYSGSANNNADYFGDMVLYGDLPYLTVTSPNGGETWQIGTNQTIAWSSAGTSGNVKIELSRNGGATWEVLFASTPDDHSQTWNVSGSASNNCTIRISDVDGSPIDASDGIFQITSPQQTISVLVPNGAEIWAEGSTQDIKWTSQNTSGNVKIELSRNNGSTWETLFASTPDDQQQSWTVTGPASTSCRVRISDVDGTPSDMSDNTFNIITTGANWSVPITINGGGTQMTRTFGGDSNASDGFDSGLDVTAAPPGMTYYTYFELNVFPNYLATDIRKWVAPYTTEINWTLKIVNANNISSNLSWDSAKLPSQGTFTLSGGNVNIDMRSQNSVSITGSVNVIIRYSSTPSVVYTFSQQGWYLISLPVTPPNNSLNVLFPTAMAAFGYNSSTGTYVPVTSLETMKGYWLLVPAATTVTISGTALTNYTQFYQVGWHLIGSVKGTANFADPNDNPNGSVISAYGYNPTTGQYFAVYPPGTGKLEEKQGYWLAVMQPCNLTIGSGGLMANQMMADNENTIRFKQQFGSQPPAPPFLSEQQTAALVPRADQIVSRNYPNPFNPETMIEYSLPQSGWTEIYIYNALGQRIRTLLSGEQSAGVHQVLWDGRNERQEMVADGIYFYRIITPNYSATQKMVLLR